MSTEWTADRLRRIDRAVLIARGWRECPSDTEVGPTHYVHRSICLITPQGAHSCYFGGVFNHRDEQWPRPTSGDGILEIMEEEEVCVELVDNPKIHKPGLREWYASTWDGYECRSGEYATTVSLAVCLAYLTKKGVEVPE